MRERNPKEAKKDLIIEAAVQVFSRKGYHNTKMDEIATAAGIGKGTIYEYFTSKLQLFQSMFEHSLQKYYHSIGTNKKSQLLIKDRLRLLLETHIKFCQANRDLTRIIFWDTQIIDPELKDWANQMRINKEKKLRAIIEEGISRGEFRDTDPQLLTVIVGAILGSIYIPIIVEGWQVDPAATAQQVVEIMMNGIKR